MEYCAIKNEDESLAKAIETLASCAGLSKDRLIDVIEAGLKIKSFQIIGDIENEDRELITALRNCVNTREEIFKLV